MTIQLAQFAQPGASPSEAAKPDSEHAALVAAVPASTGGYAEERTSRRLSEAPALWRVRVIADKPGALEKLARQLASVGARILSLHAHPHFRGVRNELVASAPAQVDASDLVAAALAAGTNDVRTWPTTARALVDSSTRTLALAAPVRENPRQRVDEIPDVAEMGTRPGLSEAAFRPGTGPRSSHH